jgi:hypothetical protein
MVKRSESLSSFIDSAALDPLFMLAWCEAIARTVPSLEIRRDPAVRYLTRYFLAGWHPNAARPGPALFLHEFHTSDPATEVHSHPWGWSQSLILVGGYREFRCEAGAELEAIDYRPGAINILKATTMHRIELLEGKCWTLFLASAYARPWEFKSAC